MASGIPKTLDLKLVDGTVALDPDATFYMHLVSVAPTLTTADTVADLTVVAGGSYAVVELANVTASAEGTGAKLDCDNPTFAALYAGSATNAVGAVVCLQAGASPASTDDVIAYLEFGAAVTLPTTSGTAQDLPVPIPATGFFKTRSS